MDNIHNGHNYSKKDILRLALGIEDPQNFIFTDESGDPVQLKEIHELYVGKLRLVGLDADGNVVIVSFEEDNNDNMIVETLSTHDDLY